MFSTWNLHPWLKAVALKHKHVGSESVKLGGRFSRAMRHSGLVGHVAGPEAPHKTLSTVRTITQSQLHPANR